MMKRQPKGNPGLIQYLYVQNLSDNVSIALVPANSPFLFNMSDLATANPNFTPPAAPQQVTPTATPRP